MPLEVRTIESAAAAEVFITATPQPGTPPEQQIRDAFEGIRDVLRDTNAKLLQERIFATAEILEQAQPVRAETYGDLDDGVPPALLAVPANLDSPFSGVQVHACRNAAVPQAIDIGGRPRGRVLEHEGLKYIALSGLSAPEAGSSIEQARVILQQTEDTLKKFGGDLFSVPRTWMWLGDILAWYDDFNAVRNQFFTERGLMGTDNYRLPASTGIGVGPLDGGAMAADVFGLVGPEGAIDYLLKGGNQNPASDYGSAFSRAAATATPGGRTVYVSGTAAIDANGITEDVGNASAQIDDTIRHVRAVFGDMGGSDADMVQTMAYCKTPEVERIFRDEWPDLPWPTVIIVGDVCRDDLLFEIEATGCPGARAS